MVVSMELCKSMIREAGFCQTDPTKVVKNEIEFNGWKFLPR
jgi:hypothetical protein